MSKKLARAVEAFARLITLPLKPARRTATIVTAAEMLCREVRVDTRHGALLFHTGTLRAFHFPWFFHRDEPETLAWIDDLADGAVLWDIGANVGQYCMYAALRPGVQVLAFEPSAASYAALMRNIEINRMVDRISAYCLAFSDRTALDTLNMADTGAGHSMHAFGATVNAYDEEIEVRFRQAAAGYSIDDFVRIFTPPLPTHIKLDVDSIEARIIAGAADLLAAGGPVRSVMVEVMGALETPRNAKIIAALEALGFEAVPKAVPEHRNMEFRRRKDVAMNTEVRDVDETPPDDL